MIKVYSIPYCPMCDLLKEELQEKEIPYESIMDKEILQNKGITHVPVLEVEGQLLNTAEALKWVKNYEN